LSGGRTIVVEISLLGGEMDLEMELGGEMDIQGFPNSTTAHFVTLYSTKGLAFLHV